ncbi:hypothetical protein D8674_021692 [Pyrus ussuriensis x Pyrus communis]|uniref:Uncharacterized protein n=1 Tax=Pyrus ussuriensis x Pyrus communis TaxID=2448454 RepID=A0A5N5GWF0_9ROSA|nr:hypothetical protein D8674_021692 [Pyrus ussuriensis x Pyrus communis]
MSPSGSTTDASSTRPVRIVISFGVMIFFFHLFATKKNTRGLCWQLKTAKVTRVTNGHIPIAYNDALAHDIGHVMHTFCLMWWKFWKAMPEETKNTVRNQLFVNSWLWLCGHFQEPGYMVSRVKANKINWENKTLLHHSGSRPFSYRMAVRQKIYITTFISNFKMSLIIFFFRGFKISKDRRLSNVYVRPGDELTESLHATMMEKSQSVLQESTSQLPDQVYVGPDFRSETKYILSGDGTCQATGEWSLFILPVTGLGYGFDAGSR